MDTASKILIVAGVSNLGYAFLLGLPLSAIRMKSPQAPRYLVVAHTGPIMAGAALLGLVFAVGLSDLSSGLESTAAWLLAAGSAAVAVGDTMNWLGGVQDAFAQRSLGWMLTALGAPLLSAGLLIILIGAVRAL